MPAGRIPLVPRGVAQPGSAPALGAGGRGFKSRRPDDGEMALGQRLRHRSSPLGIAPTVSRPRRDARRGLCEAVPDNAAKHPVRFRSGFATEDEVLDQRGMEMVGRIARRAGGLAGVIALVLAGVALPAAGRRGTVTETQHGHDEAYLASQVQNPCTGEPGTLTAIATNSVFHVTFFETSDEFWVTGTGEGTATFTPENPRRGGRVPGR
jgi:hypothetical protein